MEHIDFLIISAPSSEVHGGKGSKTIKLIKIGANVPPGFILTTKAFEQFIKESRNFEELKELLSSSYSKENVIEHSAKIIELIMNTQIPYIIDKEIKRGFILLNDSNSSFAVRSSASIEDNKHFSFAGQANTYLFQRNINDVLKSVKKCWASFFAPQSLLYFLQMKKKNTDLLLENIKMAIIIQKMVNPTVSGVLFTSNVLNNDNNQILINSSWGLGESIVSNSVNPDMIILQKDDFKIVQKTIGRKEKKSIPNSIRSGTVLINTNIPSRERLSLNEKQIRQLYDLGLMAENAFNHPQDIEWAFENDKLYILQSRPITTIKE